MRILETVRLVIRGLQADDLDELAEICGDAEIMRHVGDGQPLTREQTRRWIEKSQANYQQHGFGCFAVVAKADDRLIGYCGLVKSTNTGEQEAEIIYALKQQYWRQGLASEAAQAMLDFGLQQCRLKRIVATIDPQNQASIRIVEKWGLKFQEQRLDEHNLPEALYAIESSVD